MKIEGILLTLFLVGILLAVSISQNITGLMGFLPNYLEGECRCVELPVCTNEDRVADLCLNIGSGFDLTEEFKEVIETLGPKAYSAPGVTEPEVAPKPYVRQTIDVSKLIQQPQLPTPPPEVSPPAEKKCPDVCGPVVPVPFIIYHFETYQSGGQTFCKANSLKPTTNCLGYLWRTLGSYKKCVIVNGVGECVSASSTEANEIKKIMDYAEKEGYGEEPPPPSPE